MDLVVPAAGIGATALVGIAMVEVAREQAAPRVGNAQRAVHEDFELGVRAFLADLRDFVEREFARQDHAADAGAAPELHRRVVHRVGLHRQVDGHLGPAFADHQHQAGIGHDQRIGLERHHRRHVLEIGLELGVVRQDVADQVEPAAARLRGFDPGGEVVERAEIVVAHAQAVTRLAGVDRVGTEVQRRARHQERTGRGQQLGCFHRAGTRRSAVTRPICASSDSCGGSRKSSARAAASHSRMAGWPSRVAR